MRWSSAFSRSTGICRSSRRSFRPRSALAVAITQLLAALAFAALCRAAPRDARAISAACCSPSPRPHLSRFHGHAGDLVRRPADKGRSGSSSALTCWLVIAGRRRLHRWLASFPIALLMFARMRAKPYRLCALPAPACSPDWRSTRPGWSRRPLALAAAIGCRTGALGAMAALIVAAILGEWPLDLPARWRTAHGRKPQHHGRLESPQLPGKPFMLVAAGVLIFLAHQHGRAVCRVRCQPSPTACHCWRSPRPSRNCRPHPRRRTGQDARG